MNKRVILEHPNGMLQICGVIDIPGLTQVQKHMIYDGVHWELTLSSKHYVMYHEVSSASLEDEPKKETP